VTAVADNTDPISEDSLALDFSTRYGGLLRYVPKWGQWLTWTGSRWKPDEVCAAFDRARRVCREYALTGGPRDRVRIASAATAAAVTKLAQSDPVHATAPDQWDRDPWLYICEDKHNGDSFAAAVDLRTGEFAKPSPSDLCTKAGHGIPAPKARCPRWLEFLATVTDEDAQLQAYLQRVAGYCLTGSVRESVLFFVYGTGANGKSVFIKTLGRIWGDYAEVAPLEMFTAGTGDRHPTELAKLRGARLVTATETERGRKWAESKIKALTGGDKITARFMRQDFFDYEPQFKLMIAGNHKPGLSGVDEAIRRRIHLIPFVVTVPADERDKDLEAKLLGERCGILNWAIEGCLEWQRIGLDPPPAVLAATEEYLLEQDAVQRWLDECFEVGPDLRETNDQITLSWESWAKRNGEEVGSNRALFAELRKRGFAEHRSHGVRSYCGLRRVH
jgi:putative DNA primase/helicase